MPLKHVSQLIKCPGSLCTGSRVIQQPWEPQPAFVRPPVAVFATARHLSIKLSSCSLSSCLFGCLYLHTHRLSLLPLLFPIKLPVSAPLNQHVIIHGPENRAN